VRDDALIARSPRHAKCLVDVKIPKAQRRQLPKPLRAIERKRAFRDSASTTAHASGDSSYAEIGGLSLRTALHPRWTDCAAAQKETFKGVMLRCWT